jgi:hypothetical protein
MTTTTRLTSKFRPKPNQVSWRFSRFAGRRSRARKLKIPSRRRATYDKTPLRLMASFETCPQMIGQIRVKTAQNCAPLTPNTSVYAHNSIEFVPSTSLKNLQNTALRRAPAKLIPRLSFRLPRCRASPRAGRHRRAGLKQHRRARDQKTQSRADKNKFAPRRVLHS